MSQENVAHAKQGYGLLADAVASGDIGSLEHLFEERVDRDVVLRPAGVFPESAEVRGRTDALKFLTGQREAFESWWFEPLGFIDVGDMVIVRVRVGGRARHTGIALEFERAHVLTSRNGKVARFEIYASETEAFEAVGLRG
jgi:ketosteroid isomerase-like protein